MTLDEYKEKRNFEKTREPLAKKNKSKTKSLIFVIQKHNARRLHYDFRLEFEGVLKSWAVPKNLPNNSKEKRLAIMTEDHPLEYAKFSGKIPQGQYGAGKVEIWDNGKYANITIKEGKVKNLKKAIEEGHFIIYLKGKKTNGSYAFTKTGENWIIIKKKEEKDSEEKKIQDSVSISGKNIALTNTDKLLDEKLTKGNFIEYYQKISRLMLPHIKDRLISMYKFPNGVAGKKFYIKNAPEYFPEWIACKRLKSKEGKNPCYVSLDNEAGIIYLANQVVEIHIMPSKKDSPGMPDKIIFDFDPSEKDLRKLKEMVIKMKIFLEKLGFKVFIMTTGGKGYHLVCPIKKEMENKEVRDFAYSIAKILENNHPNDLTTELIKEKRKKRIFIDVNRISPLQTSIAPYSVRAKQNLPIAAPFDWTELPNINPDTFTISNPQLEDPWKNFYKAAVSLKKIIKNLKK